MISCSSTSRLVFLTFAVLVCCANRKADKTVLINRSVLIDRTEANLVHSSLISSVKHYRIDFSSLLHQLCYRKFQSQRWVIMSSGGDQEMRLAVFISPVYYSERRKIFISLSESKGKHFHINKFLCGNKKAKTFLATTNCSFLRFSSKWIVFIFFLYFLYGASFFYFSLSWFLPRRFEGLFF